MSQHAKYLRQTSFTSRVIAWLTRHTDKHTPDWLFYLDH